MNDLAPTTALTAALPQAFAAWFEGRGWRAHAHQLEMLAAARAGQSALLIAPTGGGKTLAGFLPSLVELAESPGLGLHTLYVSPLKALAVDIHRNLTEPITEMGLEFACDQHSKEGAVAYISAILEGWDMVHFSPETFVEQGDLIAMFGGCAWTWDSRRRQYYLHNFLPEQPTRLIYCLCSINESSANRAKSVYFISQHY